MQAGLNPRPSVPFYLFARSHLGLTLYPWQLQILRAVEQKRVSALVCNGGGKSSVVVASLVLGFLHNFPKGRAAITSGSYMQLSKILWPAIEQYRSLPYFRNWTWNEVEIKTPEGGRAFGFSTDDPQRVEGWHHELPDSPLLYVVDEAKSVPDELFQGIGRCTPTFYIQVSSAGSAQGFFYHSFNKHKSIFWTCKIKSSDCPHITDEQRAIDRVTLDRAVYAAKHASEFDEDLSGSAIPLRIINAALERQATMMHHPGGMRVAGLDFAAGGAENTIAVRDGNRVELVAAWRNPDPTQACREFIEHFKRLKLHPSEIFGDAGGLGAVMCSNLKDAGWPINEVHNGDPAEDSVHYANRGGEIWFKAAHMIEFGIGQGQHIIIPEDKLFIEQATSRRREYDAKQRLRIESKKNLTERNVPSPDRADAIFMAMVCRPSQWNAQRVAQVHLPKNPFAPGFVRF
jgi:phage terminase large subunit